VIRNGVDCDRFRPDPQARTSVRDELGLAAETPLVGIVAALRPEKHHTMLIEAAARLRDRPDLPHFLIVGDGPEREKIRSHARTLGVEDRVHLLGTRHDTPRLLAALDLFALCSLNEASPVSILEALACEIPVVATDVGSVSESVIPGETGRLVPSEDVVAFAESIDGLLDDPENRARMGAHGRLRVVQNGSLESMVDGYQRLIADLYDRQRVAVTRPSRTPSRSTDLCPTSHGTR
jgi:glycosyltransferase involved in cell wall biosynthesis